MSIMKRCTLLPHQFSTGIDMNKIKGCIFDLDGVIVDTAKYHFLAWKRLADELGINFSATDNERLKGVSRIESLEILLSMGNIRVDTPSKFKFAELKNSWYVDYISKIDRKDVLPGVERFITFIRGKNIKIALGSSSKNADLILTKTGLVTLFDAIIDGNKVSNAKPNPEVFLLCARELNLRPENCVVFEDSEAGLIAAKNANMLAIGVGSAGILNIADKVISDFNSILFENLLKFDYA